MTVFTAPIVSHSMACFFNLLIFTVLSTPGMVFAQPPDHGLSEGSPEAESGSGSFFSLPLVPAGTYLEFCSYSYIRFTDGKMSAICGSGHSEVSMPLDDAEHCYSQGMDINWNTENGLFCDRQPRTPYLLGNTAVPVGPYLARCSGVLFDQLENKLYGSCQTGNGHFMVSSLHLDSCPAHDEPGVGDNGRLGCQSPGKKRMPIPFGKYLDNCLSWYTSFSEEFHLESRCYDSIPDTFDCCACGNCGSWPKCRDYDTGHKSANLTHYLYFDLSMNARKCDALGLDICEENRTVYCSRALSDDLYFSFTPDSPPLPGPYLQECNHVQYDKVHDVLSANCAVGSVSHIYEALPVRNQWTFDHTRCVETEPGKQLSTSRQRASTLINASQCRDKDGASLIGVDSRGRLTCPLSGNFSINASCGHLYTPASAGQDQSSGDYFSLLGFVFGVLGFSTGGGVFLHKLCRLMSGCKYCNEYKSIE